MILEEKIQVEAIKLLDGPDAKSRCVQYSEGDRAVYLTVNGYYAVRIPESIFWLDRNKLRCTNSIKSLFKGLPDTAKELLFKHSIGDGKSTKAVLACDEFETWINAGFFKLLSQKTCKMYATDAKSPIFFVRNGLIYAVCMPLAQ